MADQRRFPAPWRAEKMPGGFVVRDANGQALAYVYSRASETDAMQAKVLTDDEARRIAANIAKLPVLLARESREALEAIKAEVGSLLFSAMTAPRPHCVAGHIGFEL
jgi:hypothetical protein